MGHASGPLVSHPGWHGHEPDGNQLDLSDSLRTSPHADIAWCGVLSAPLAPPPLPALPCLLANLDSTLQIDALDVIALTSVMQYAETERTIPDIGRELSVDIDPELADGH